MLELVSDSKLQNIAQKVVDYESLTSTSFHWFPIAMQFHPQDYEVVLIVLSTKMEEPISRTLNIETFLVLKDRF